MNRLQISTALFAAAMGIIAVTPKASADAWDKKTIVTISGQMEVPGVTLEPGTYVFKLADSSSDRHIVMIQNERMNHTFATILAIPNYRLRPTGKSQFLFWETPAGEPAALRAWFYPADNFGQEFVYPKGKFTRVSQVTHQESTPAPVVAQTTPPPEEPAAAAPAPPPPAEEPAVIAQNTPPPAPEPAPQPAPVETPAPAALPQTASIMPLLAFGGFLSLGVAFLLGIAVKRIG
ncbi:MAG TPA: hypothetical protein VHZ74_19975 [Bryobacteraceae bacterium]|jgi:hypothetical protein|nr:hypothetical protein [Bryobacteraceae bacterium]